MRLVAHRGARSTTPENTMAAFRTAQTLCVDLVEGDVALTSDAIAVMIHQETLQPNAERTRLILASRDEGRAWLNETNWESIRTIDAGSWFDARFAAERIPLLEHVLALGWNRQTLLLDLIDPYYWRDENDLRMCRAFSLHVIPILRNAIEKGAQLNVLAFNPRLLEVFHRELPAVDRTLALWTNVRGRESMVAKLAEEFEVSTISIADFMLRDETIWEREIRRLGIKLGVYELTPDSAKDFQDWTPEKRRPMWDLILEKNVDVFTTDFPEEFNTYRNTRGV